MLNEAIDTTTPGGRLVSHLFSGVLGQFERNLIQERTRAGLTAAAAQGGTGGRKPVLTEDKLNGRRFQRPAIANGYSWNKFLTMVDQVLPKTGSNLELPFQGPVRNW